MNGHNYDIAASLLPQASPGSRIRVRHLDGNIGRQYFTAGGFFSEKSSKMRQADLVKACALTIDVDAYDWSGASMWGEDRDARKKAMRDASEAAVLAWFDASGFVEVVREEAVRVGLPSRPNRILYTGQGINLVYWIEDAIGWTSGEGWTADRMKATIKRFHAARPDLWFWDSAAKDLGTRIFPLPTKPHRDTGKIVRVLESHDQVQPLADWFAELEAAYPVPKKVRRAPTSQPVKKKRSTSQSVKSGAWSTVIHDPLIHPDFEVGGRGKCPACDGSGYRRLDEAHYSCFSCRTHFRVVPAAAHPTDEEPGTRKIALAPDGRALWPRDVPTHLVNKGGTGTGKTYLMERVSADWSTGSHRRVVAVAPTLALAGGLADRLGLQHADAKSSRTWRNGSLVTCFAGLVSKTAGIHGDELANTCLLIDEVESCLLQLFGMLSGDRAREAYNILIDLVAGAGRVFLADAHAGAVTAAFIEDVDAYRRARGEEPTSFETWTTEKTRFDFVFVSPVTRKTRKGDEVLVRSSDAEHRGLLLERIEAGKRLAIYCPGRDAALGLARAIRKKTPSKKVVVVVGATSREDENDLSEAGLTADVLIFNNAMSTGVSYDREHYDEVHLLLGRGTVADGISVEQAAHRIRRPKTKTITISGTVGAVVDDWRTNPKKHIEAAVARFAAAVVSVHEWSGLKLASDWFSSAESRRLGAIQATIVASRYARGYRWLIYYLAARHNFVHSVGRTNDDFVDATRAERDAVKMEAAKSVAAAEPLTPLEAERVERIGADTRAEYDALQARKMTSIFGDAYAAAEDEEKVELVYQTQNDALARKTRTFAVVWLLLNDDNPDNLRAAAAGEVRTNATSTVMSASLSIPTANVVVDLVRGIGRLGRVEDGRVYVDRPTAAKIVELATPVAERNGIGRRSDVARNPIRQIQAWIEPAGLRLRSVRPAGQARQYFLARSDMERLSRLAKEYVDKWRKELQ